MLSDALLDFRNSGPDEEVASAYIAKFLFYSVKFFEAFLKKD